jgi:lyso-ornithine lipid O-acyltransferase
VTSADSAPRPSRAVFRHGRAALRTGHLLWTSLSVIGESGRVALPPGDRAQRLRSALREIAQSHRMSISVEGRWPSGPAILVANHLSYLDPVVIGACHPLAPIAKSQFRGWPVIGAAAARMGVIFVDRSDPLSGAAALRHAMAALRAGVNVLTFPEGTTTDGHRDVPYRLGAFGLAALTGYPVVPIGIRYSSPDLIWVGDAAFLPHYLRTAARPSLSALLRVGQPLWPRLRARGSTSSVRSRRAISWELLRASRAAIERLIADDPDDKEWTNDSTTSVAVSAPRPDAIFSSAHGNVA